jgi:gelsolin
LYRVSEDGTIQLQEGKLVMEMLDSSGCFIVDCKNEIYVWLGKATGKDYRNVASEKAQELLTQGERASWTEVYRTVEGGESVLFCEKFANW